MRRLQVIVVLLLLLLNGVASAQTVSDSALHITSRDTARLNIRIRTLVSKDYLGLLNAIVMAGFEDEERKFIIDMSLPGGEREMFVNSDVRVEIDYIPGNDTLKVRPDSKIGDYLHAFKMNYVHTDNATIFFENIQMSKLKYSSLGFYVDVIFDCFFKGVYRNGNKEFPRFIRKATILARKESGIWKPFIGNIAFSNGELDDSSNVYSDIENVVYRVSDILDIEKNNIENVIRSKKVARDDDLEDAESLFSQKKLRLAYNSFQKAKEHDLDLIRNGVYATKLKEIKSRLKAVNNAIQDSTDQVKSVKELKEKSEWEFKRYNFEEANRIANLLSDQFKYSDDELDGLRRKLGKIIGPLDALNFAAQKALEKGDKQSMRIYNDEMSKVTLNSGDNTKELMAEAYFRKAKFTLQFDKTEREEALKCLEKSLYYSENVHPRAIEEKARLEAELKKVTEAIRDYTSLTISSLVSNDEKAVYFRYLGDLYRSQGNNEKALVNYAEAVKKQNLSDKMNITPFISKASIEYDMAKMTDCILTCDSGLSKLPDVAELHFIKGKALNKVKRQEEAGKSLRKALSIGLPKQQREEISQISNTYLFQGREQLVLKKPEEAIECFNRAVFIDSSQQALFERAKVKFSLKRYDDVIMDADALLRLDQKFNDVHLLKATTYKQKGSLKEAIEECSAELGNDSSDLIALSFRARCYLTDGYFQLAEADYLKTFTAQPSDSIWGYLIYCYFKNGQYRKAVMCADEKHKSVQMDYNGCFYTGRSYLILGEEKKALEYFGSAAKLRANEPELKWYMGNAFEKAGEYDDALDIYLNLKSESWKDTASYRAAMVCIQRKDEGDFNLASTKLENYIQMKGDSAECEAVAWLVVSLIRSGQVDRLEKRLDYIATECSKSAMALYAQACNYAIKGNRSEVLKMLKSALEISPDLKSEAESERSFRIFRRDDQFQELIEK